MDVIVTLILVIAGIIIGGLIGALTVYSIVEKKQTKNKPVGSLYLNGSELFLDLYEDIIGKKRITLRVIQINDSHK